MRCEIQPGRKNREPFFSIKQKKDNHIDVLGKSWQNMKDLLEGRKLNREGGLRQEAVGREEVQS